MNFAVKSNQSKIIAISIEGGTNKLGVGIVQYDRVNGTFSILSNPRKTYITPPGEDFLPRQLHGIIKHMLLR